MNFIIKNIISLQNNIIIKCSNELLPKDQDINKITLLYEKIRIPYFYKNNLHNYIVDFVDLNNKILYEIKPNSARFSNEKNIIKEKYANEWSLINGYNYNVISDDWFFKNYDEKILINNPDFEKMNKNLKQFLKYENKENN